MLRPTASKTRCSSTVYPSALRRPRIARVGPHPAGGSTHARIALTVPSHVEHWSAVESSHALTGLYADPTFEAKSAGYESLTPKIIFPAHSAQVPGLPYT